MIPVMIVLKTEFCQKNQRVRAPKGLSENIQGDDGTIKEK
jgi:hypothetical protein